MANKQKIESKEREKKYTATSHTLIRRRLARSPPFPRRNVKNVFVNAELFDRPFYLFISAEPASARVRRAAEMNFRRIVGTQISSLSLPLHIYVYLNGDDKRGGCPPAEDRLPSSLNARAFVRLDKQSVGGLAAAGEAQNKKRKRNLVDRMSGKLRSREIALLKGQKEGRGRSGGGEEERKEKGWKAR